MNNKEGGRYNSRANGEYFLELANNASISGRPGSPTMLLSVRLASVAMKEMLLGWSFLCTGAPYYSMGPLPIDSRAPYR